MRRHTLASALVSLVLVSLACSLGTPTPTVVVPTAAEPTATVPPTPVPAAAEPVFAAYSEPAVNAVPSVAQPAIASDLSNVRVPFLLSDGLRTRLGQDGFVVAPGTEKEFFTVYEKARYDNQPVFVTSDSLLHVYHLLFDKVLRTAETEHFIPLLRDLNASMLAQTDAQYQALKNGPWEDAARRSVAFIGVGSKLLDPNVQVPAYASDLVEAELALIQSADGILPSPLFPGLEHGEDYTQYIPRGHYTLSDDLKHYFQSMMWYGRMTFRLNARDPEVGKAETRSALLVVLALKDATVNGHPALDAWQDLYSPTAFMVGRSDDLTALQYMDVFKTVYGGQPSAAGLVDEAKLSQFIDLANKLPPPKILGIVIAVTEDEEAQTKGLRFMGQRFVPDAYVFRQLIYRNVGTNEDPRGLPKGLDVFAAMGSQRAYSLLDQMGETHYANYPEQMTKMQAWMSGLGLSDWTETLYNTWMYTFQPLIAVPGDGYPAFMRSTAWLDKELNTVLGSWAELKHDTILYAKQVYAELGGGPPPPPPEPPMGYVEPLPEFYARLAALTAMTSDGLGSRGLLDPQDATSLDTLHTLALSLQTMAEKELQNQPLTEDEYNTIRFYGGQLEDLTMAAADSDISDPNARRYMEQEPQAAVVADVATNPAPPPMALEEAVGRVNPIYVVVPMVDTDGTTYLQVAKGAVFSYYEFTQPISDRLTDDAWRAMLDDGTAPAPPDWTSSFRADQTEFADIGSVVQQFRLSVTSVYWFRQREYLSGGGPGADAIWADVQAFAAQGHYLGHQLVRAEFRSFDQQSPTLAVVTSHEIWQDTVYGITQDYPDASDPVISTSGPYPLDVTYTLQMVDSGNGQGPRWQVTNVVYAQGGPSFPR